MESKELAPRHSGWIDHRTLYAPATVAAFILGALLGGSASYFADVGTARTDVVSRFHHRFYHSTETWLRNQWLGVPTYQNPNDAWIIQEIICEVRPDVIVETGTALGGSAALWATVLRQVKPDGRVLSIDVEDQVGRAAEIPVVEQAVDFLVGSSVDSALVARVEREVQGKRVLVILDSNHRKDHVLKELQLYSTFVSLGSYLIVQDTNLNGHPVRDDFGPGPMEAVEAFLQTTERFEIDEFRERLLFTMHPRGYLQRVGS